MEKNYKITRGRTEIEVPHPGDSISFVSPAYGPGTYANVGSQIESAGLVTPTMAETASLVYQAFKMVQKKNQNFQILEN